MTWRGQRSTGTGLSCDEDARPGWQSLWNARRRNAPASGCVRGSSSATRCWLIHHPSVSGSDVVEDGGDDGLMGGITELGIEFRVTVTVENPAEGVGQ